MAGYDVWGSDIEPQPNFPWPDQFYQFDITKITDKQIANIRKNFDAVAGSPPCKGYSVTKTLANEGHPKLVEYARWLFDEIDLPYIIENVPGAPLINPVQVCGSGLGLRVQRHRLFESNCDIAGIECNHEWQDRDLRYIQVPNGPGSEVRRGIVYVYGRGDGSHFRGQSQERIWSQAMGIDWMKTDELAQAIPPLYTFHIGKQLREYI
jgi:DNA (cytosine-5)-methyltransferase 1